MPTDTLHTLHHAQQRLYLVPAQPTADGAPAQLPPPDGQVRAMVLTLAHPTDPDGLQRVWQAVQADLGLPAPAMAVNGTNGLQLWFSVAQPVPSTDAAAFVQGLRQRYLPDGETQGDGDFPPANGHTTTANLPALPPAQAQAQADQWSAFVAPDLVRIFAEEPWLSRAPGGQAQADLLARLESMTLHAFEQALVKVRPAAANPTDPTLPLPTKPPPARQPDAPRPPHAEAASQFLLMVMNDPAVDMALRIEAAKALLSSPGA